MALLGLKIRVLFDQLQLCMTARHDPSKDLLEVVVELHEVLLECLLLLSVEILQQRAHAFLSLVRTVRLLSQLRELAVVLLVPFLRVPVLAWELVKLSK
jgi:predicted membrane-bound spermidine synthase